MPLVLNGTTITDVVCDGTNIINVVCNGTEIYRKVTQVVLGVPPLKGLWLGTPTLQSSYPPAVGYYSNVQNPYFYELNASGTYCWSNPYTVTQAGTYYMNLRGYILSKYDNRSSNNDDGFNIYVEILKNDVVVSSTTYDPEHGINKNTTYATNYIASYYPDQSHLYSTICNIGDKLQARVRCTDYPFDNTETDSEQKNFTFTISTTPL